MATKQKIERVLMAMARNYDKPQQWAIDSFPVWWQALKNERDQDIHRTAEAVLREKRKVPTVATFREVMKADPLTQPIEALQGCAACASSGWREVAWHRIQSGRLLVTSYAAGCDCPRGQQLIGGSAQHWRDIVQAYKAHPSTDAVYHTSEDHPVLTMQERYHPDTVERLKNMNNKSTNDSFKRIID